MLPQSEEILSNSVWITDGNSEAPDTVVLNADKLFSRDCNFSFVLNWLENVLNIEAVWEELRVVEPVPVISTKLARKVSYKYGLVSVGIWVLIAVELAREEPLKNFLVAHI